MGESKLETPSSGEMIRLIESVGRALRTPTDYHDAVRAVVECVVPELADLAVAFVGAGGPGQVEVRHRDPSRNRRAGELVARAAPALLAAVRGNAARGLKQWRWIPTLNELTVRHFTRGDRVLKALLTDLEARSLIVVPLRSSGRIHGALALLRIEPGRPFQAGELAAAQMIAHRAASAIEKAELGDVVRESAATRGRLEGVVSKWIQVFQQAAWGAAIVDLEEHRIDAVNPAFARLHGYQQPEQLIGRRFSDLLPSERAQEPRGWATVGDHDPPGYESEHRRADGSVIPVLVNVTVLQDWHSSAVVTVQDLTALKRAEERLRRAQRMEAVGRLSGGVAHEVNNMMTIILGFSDLLIRTKELPDRLRGDVDEIQKAATRAGHITRQLLAYSRRLVLQPAVLDLDAVVGEMAQALQPLLPVHTRVETQLGAGGARIRADRSQLEQVMINLAFNARDAMPAGGRITLATLALALDADAGRDRIGIPIVPGPYVCLEVRDTGAGLSPEVRSHLFEPFFTTKEVGQGSGLGLATVYGIVKQSGGYVWAEPRPGGGTTFTVCLPQVEGESLAPEPVTEASESKRPHTGEVVLVVEDEAGVRAMAGRVLRDQGYRVVEARDGREALAALERLQRIDLLLTDVVMPDMSGGEVALRIRELRPGVSVLYMSGYPKDDILQQRQLHASDPVLQKPFTREALLERVREALEAAGRAM